MIAQLMPLGGWVWLLVLPVNSFRVGLLWTWYWTLGFWKCERFLDWLSDSKCPKKDHSAWAYGGCRKKSRYLRLTLCSFGGK